MPEDDSHPALSMPPKAVYIHVAGSVLERQRLPGPLALAVIFTEGETLVHRAFGSMKANVDSAAMTQFDDHGRPEPPLAADEVETIIGFLEYQRATFKWKTDQLDMVALLSSTAASSMTLGGMLKHLACVEEYWFSQWVGGRDVSPPWRDAPWDDDPDWDWHSAAHDSPDQLRELWSASVKESRSRLAEALTQGDVSQVARRTWPDGRAPSVRWIICHMIEEYARHNGHADLLREAIDGTTGE